STAVRICVGLFHSVSRTNSASAASGSEPIRDPLAGRQQFLAFVVGELVGLGFGDADNARYRVVGTDNWRGDRAFHPGLARTRFGNPGVVGLEVRDLHGFAAFGRTPRHSLAERD